MPGAHRLFPELVLWAALESELWASTSTTVLSDCRKGELLGVGDFEEITEFELDTRAE